MSDFMIRALLAGLGVALAAGPLGCFVVWRRMAYFGDAMAHAAILGVAIAFGLTVSVYVSVIAVTLLVALLIFALESEGFGVDTALGVLSHGALAAGLVAASLIPSVRGDLSAFLFGDVLAVRAQDLWVIWAAAIAVCALLAWRWSALLTATLNPDLASASGIRPRQVRVVLTVSLALLVAVAIKVVGALLITALLIIPAAAARPLSRTPEQMVLGAVGIGAASTLLGLLLTYQLDTPAGPSIVLAALVFFVLTILSRRVLGGRG